MVEIELLEEKEYSPETITLRGIFNVPINITNVALWMPINIIYDNDGNRIICPKKKRKQIEYYGEDGAIISMCYGKKIIRGIRTSAMNNMLSTDIQCNNKNIHLKISKDKINSVGIKSYKSAKHVFDNVMKHIINLKIAIEKINNIPEDIKKKAISFVEEKLKNKSFDMKIIQMKNFISKNIKNQKEKEFLNFCTLYIEDDIEKNIDKYIEKIKLLYKNINIYEGKLDYKNLSVYNQVYHIEPIKDQNFKIPLLHLAIFLGEKGFNVDYRNWGSQGLNICLPTNEKGDDNIKNYKHRFSIHNKNIRQFSPTNKQEAYNNYKGLIIILKEFFNKKDIDFSKYSRYKTPVHDISKFIPLS